MDLFSASSETKKENIKKHKKRNYPTFLNYETSSNIIGIHIFIFYVYNEMNNK